MSKMKIDVGLKYPTEANKFLRALWAQLRREFGNLAGVYSPNRNTQSKIISFGRVQLGDNHVLHVSIGYVTKGSLEYIVFSDERNVGLSCNRTQPAVFTKIRNSVEVALRTYGHPKIYEPTINLALSSSKTFCLYQSERIAVRPIAPGRAELSIQVEAFDDLDAQREFMIRAHSICDHLTAWTNISIELSTEREIYDRDDEHEPIAVNSMWADSDWLDGASYVGDRIALTPDQLMWADASAKQTVDYTHPLFRATRHFAEALRLRTAGNFPEISQTLLVSALEAIGSGASDFQTCPKCGQTMYKISSRLYELAKTHLGESTAKIIKVFYVHRSKFLHLGLLPARDPYTFGFSPQLDTDDPSGCVGTRTPSANINLIEFTSFILRAECKSWSTSIGAGIAEALPKLGETADITPKF